MLVRIGPAPPETGALGSLMACHARIRRHAELAEKLADAPATTPVDEVKHAGAQLVRYFTEALPLHQADEEKALTPRLLALDPAVKVAVDAMEAQHEHLDALLATLVGHWRRCADTGEVPPRDSVTAAHELADGLRAHLVHEEGAVFPHIARLPAAEQDGLLADIRNRREA